MNLAKVLANSRPLNKKQMENSNNPILDKMWGRERCKVEKMYQKRSFLAVFNKIWSKTPSNKTVAMVT